MVSRGSGGYGANGAEVAKVMKQSPLNQLYPDADWTALFTKLGDLLRQDYDWSKDVAAIKSPVMLVFADADAVRTAHVIEFFVLLGGGRLDAGMDGSGETQCAACRSAGNDTLRCSLISHAGCTCYEIPRHAYAKGRVSTIYRLYECKPNNPEKQGKRGKFQII